MNREVYIYVPGDRHSELHERQFARTFRSEADSSRPLLDQVTDALKEAGLHLEQPERVTIDLGVPYE